MNFYTIYHITKFYRNNIYLIILKIEFIMKKNINSLLID